jgi:uncharacterized membrane protein YdfJ with MMPL/SSD domain
VSRLADLFFSRRGAALTLGLWLALAAGLFVAAPSLASVTSNAQSDFLPAAAESTRALQLQRERFPQQDGLPAIVVFHRPSGLNETDRAKAAAFAAWLRSADRPAAVSSSFSVFDAPAAADALVARDGTTMLVFATLEGSPSEAAFRGGVEAVAARAAALAGDGLEARLTGPAGIIADAVRVFAAADARLLAGTTLLILVLLVLIYRAPVVALVPLLAVGWVYLVVSGLGALLVRGGGLVVNGQTSALMTVLLFGAGTDYCLFLVSRYREELLLEADARRAMRRAFAGVWEAVVSAAGTVVVAMLALLLADFRGYQVLGPLLALAVACMLLAGLTMVPAIFMLLGRRAFWPFIPRFGAARRSGAGLWGRIGWAVGRRPRLALLFGTALLAVLAAGAPQLRESYSFIASFPEGTPSRAGFALLRDHFPAGQLAPTELYVDLGPREVAAEIPALTALTQALAQHPDVASVQSPAWPTGRPATLPEPVRAQAARQFQSTDGRVARFSVTLRSDPYGAAAFATVEDLRAIARAWASRTPGASVLVGGPTAVQVDTREANGRDLRTILPIVLVLIGGILALLLRSVIAPLYLLASVVLSFFAALGLSVAVFQGLLGHDGVSYAAPFYMFVFIVALGADYTIFIMSRIREEIGRRPLEEAVAHAVGSTGGVITSAGLILAGTFAVLMTLPLRDLFQLGFAVAVGILIDTFVVRTLIVPSVVLVLGRAALWPGRARAQATLPSGERVPV